MNKKKSIVAIVILLVVVIAVWYALEQPASQPSTSTQSSSTSEAQNTNPIATASYVCDGGKTIDAKFYQGQTKPPAGPNEPPIPGGSVKISLSDGRTMTLQQTLSADGSRYSNGNPMIQGNETFVFWSKGNGAFVLENGQQQTYSGCIAVVPDPGNLPGVYESGSNGFSIRYPAGYTVNPNFQYQELGPGKEISGVSFTIPTSTAAGTNLGRDSYVSVEEIPQTQECTADLFLPPNSMSGVLGVTTTTDNGVTYSVASSTGAGAGNRYVEVAYAIPGTNPCIAVHYFIHYGVIENYPQGAVRAFDEPALLDQFNAIRRTLTLQ
jgi:membrane-bound inhibitor of C-type lysozyme